jgi:hypothetical protein
MDSYEQTQFAFFETLLFEPKASPLCVMFLKLIQERRKDSHFVLYSPDRSRRPGRTVLTAQGRNEDVKVPGAGA